MTASMGAGYSGTPLAKKLGIKPGATVCTIAAPPEFAKLIALTCPADVRFVQSSRSKRNLTIWFVRSLAELNRGIKRAVAASEYGPIWMCWQKKSSGIETDAGESEIRNTGLANGIVDFKVCAIDQTWSGLCFARRKVDTKKARP
jgi:hypothetical protein